MLTSPLSHIARPLQTTVCVAIVLLTGGCGPDGEGGMAEEPAAAEVVAVESLRQRLPAVVGALPRTEVEGDVQRALGAEVAGATAHYGAEPGETLVLALTDLGSAEMVEMMGYGWGLGAAAGVERVGGYPAVIEEGPTAGDATIRVLVGDRFLIESVAEGGGVDAARAGVQSLDLAALAALGGR